MCTLTRLEDGWRRPTMRVAAALLAIACGLTTAAAHPPPATPPPAAAPPPAVTPPPAATPAATQPPLTSPTSARQPAKFSTAQLEQIVAPIALYPDQLAIQVM